MSEPRKHHVGVSAFYLEGFADPDPDAKGQLWVFDYESGRRYRSSPSNACRETDFYRLDEPGADPNLLEKIRADHEDLTAPSVLHVGGGEGIERKHIAETLSYAALLAASDRRGLQQVAQAGRMSLGTQLRRGEVTAEQWNQLREAEIRNGSAADAWLEYADALKGVRDGTWFPPQPRVPTLLLIPEAQDFLLRMLEGRAWELHVTDSTTTGGFICSDSPLTWGDLSEAVAGRQLSLDSHNIEVTFPVSRNTALVSYPGARNSTVAATEEIVAHVNMRTLQMGARRLVFHPHEEFLLQRASGAIHPSSDYFKYVADARRRGIIRP